MNYWLVKVEPDVLSWEQFVLDGLTIWDGVRNYAARNHLKSMKLGDQVLYYHSNIGKEVKGIAEVLEEFFQDPTTEDERWVAVKLIPKLSFNHPVSLQEIKNEPELQHLALIKQSRLSVMPVSKEEFDKICQMGGI